MAHYDSDSQSIPELDVGDTLSAADYGGDDIWEVVFVAPGRVWYSHLPKAAPVYVFKVLASPECSEHYLATYGLEGDVEGCCARAPTAIEALARELQRVSCFDGD